jgi:hypothetical protein
MEKIKTILTTEIIMKATVMMMIMIMRLIRGKTLVAAGNPVTNQYL